MVAWWRRCLTDATAHQFRRKSWRKAWIVADVTDLEAYWATSPRTRCPLPPLWRRESDYRRPEVWCPYRHRRVPFRRWRRACYRPMRIRRPSDPATRFADGFPHHRRVRGPGRSPHDARRHSHARHRESPSTHRARRASSLLPKSLPRCRWRLLQPQNRCRKSAVFSYISSARRCSAASCMSSGTTTSSW